MPTAKWLTPPTLAGGIADYAPEPEPRGLFGFLGAGPDFGADAGDRLGVIGQILMNLGAGRGGAGIAEASGAADARSLRRRERRKAERMVARMADKLEGSNPEMAAAFRANTEFGMQMLGKMYESEWSSKARLGEIEKEQELIGNRELAKLRETERLRQEGSPFYQIYKNLQGEGTGAGGEMPPITAAPGPITTTSGVQVESSPDMTTAQPIPVPMQGQPVVGATQLPNMGSIPLPELNRNPRIAQAQKAFAPMVGVPLLSAGEVNALLAAEAAGGTDTTTVIQNILKNRQDQQNWYRDQAIKQQDEQQASLSLKTTAEALAASVVPDRTGALTQNQARYKAQLLNIANMTDLVAGQKAFDDLNKQNAQEYKDAKDISFKGREVDIAEQKRAQEAAEFVASTKETDVKARGEMKVTFNRANTIKRHLDQIKIELVNSGNEPVHGPLGALYGNLPGSTRANIETLLNTVDSAMALQANQTLRRYSPTGAALGNTTDTDMQLLKAEVADVRAALASGRLTTFAIKSLYNHVFNELTPDSGERYNLETPDFTLEPYNAEQHDPAEYQLQQNEKKAKAITDPDTGDVIRKK